MKSSKLIKRSKRCRNSPQAQNAQKCQDMCGPYMLLNGARSAPEAKFLPISSKSSKVPKLMQLRRILKIFKSLGLPAFKPSKHILKFENPPKPQKFSNLRIVLNPRGTLCSRAPPDPSHSPQPLAKPARTLGSFGFLGAPQTAWILLNL